MTESPYTQAVEKMIKILYASPMPTSKTKQRLRVDEALCAAYPELVKFIEGKNPAIALPVFSEIVSPNADALALK